MAAIKFSKLVLLLAMSVTTLSQEYKDPRDEQVYRTVTIQGIIWFADNLNYEMEGSYCYDNIETNCDNYGRLYKWEAALAACPNGWHLSTEYEWQQLEMALGMELQELGFVRNRGTNEGGKMKKGNSSGLDVEYAGWRQKNGVFRALGENAAFWTSTEADFGHAWHRDIDITDEFVYRSRVVKSYSLCVRCVKNNFELDEPEE